MTTTPPQPTPDAPAEEVVEAAWLDYRDQMKRERPWCDGPRLARQMRKRDFIAGYRAALSSSAMDAVRAEALRAIADRVDLMEIGRLAIEDELVEWRDSRRFVLPANNGFVIKEYDGSPSDTIRFGPHVGVRIALRAIAAALHPQPGTASGGADRCSTCGGSLDDPPCSRSADGTVSGHTSGGGAAQQPQRSGTPTETGGERDG